VSLNLFYCSFSQVDGHGKFQRVSGTNVGGGTYWGLGRLMTKCKRCCFSAHGHLFCNLYTSLISHNPVILFQF
jgi:hypothetical protein